MESIDGPTSPRPFDFAQGIRRDGTDFAPSPMLLTMVSNRPVIDRRNPEVARWHQEHHQYLNFMTEFAAAGLKTENAFAGRNVAPEFPPEI